MRRYAVERPAPIFSRYPSRTSACSAFSTVESDTSGKAATTWAFVMGLLRNVNKLRTCCAFVDAPAGAFSMAVGVEKDTLPPRLLREELPSGPAKGKVAELQVMLADYYDARGWTAEGDPTDAKFQELRLQGVV